MTYGGPLKVTINFNEEMTLDEQIQEIVRKYSRITTEEVLEVFLNDPSCQSQVVRILHSSNPEIFGDDINEGNILEEFGENDTDMQIVQLFSESGSRFKNFQWFNENATNELQNTVRFTIDIQSEGTSRKRANNDTDDEMALAYSKRSSNNGTDNASYELPVKSIDNRFVLGELEDGRLLCVSASYNPDYAKSYREDCIAAVESYPEDYCIDVDESDPEEDCIGVLFGYYELDPVTKCYKFSPQPNNISWENGLHLTLYQCRLLCRQLLPYIEFQATCIKGNIAACKNGKFTNAMNLFCKKRLGTGSYGTVYEAYDPDRLKLVALKRQGLSSISTKEVAILFQFQFSSHSPRLYENVIIGKRVYMNFQLLGPDLWILQHKRTSCGRFSVQCVVRLTRQILEALRHFQSLGLIHGDVSMRNLTIGRLEHRDTVYLVDYGLSYPANDGKVHKNVGQFIGTLRYASPFVHEERRVHLSPRDDLYSLFYCNYEMTNSVLPWEKVENMTGLSDVEKQRQVGIMKRMYSVEKLCKLLPPGMETFVEHLVSLGPADKPNFDLLDDSLKQVLRNLNLKEDAPFDWQLPSTDSLYYWPKKNF